MWNFTFSHSFEGNLLSVHASKADELYLNTIPTGSLLVITRRNGWPTLFNGFGKEMLSGSDQSFKMDEPSVTTTSRRNLLAIVLPLYCERKLSGSALPNFTFSHSFEVHKMIVGFCSSIKTFSDNNIQKESTGNGPP